MVYEKGTIKVVWIERDLHEIYSKMFDNEADAAEFGETKEDYVIFSLIKQEHMEEFAWELLPYGKYKLYLSALEIFRKGDALRLIHKAIST
jgi:hypothetical protein